MVMEKGKSYLVLLKKKKQSLVREIECMDETRTCYKIKFVPTGKSEFGLDLGDYKWVLKNEFESRFELIEELPEKKKNVNNIEVLDKITEKNTFTFDELFGKKTEESISFEKSTEM